MSNFKALLVSETGPRTYSASVVERSVDDLPEGEVEIRVRYSSVNYKDALSAAGNKAVTRDFPHTPGIDASGEVISCTTSEFSEGEEVIVTGYDLGMNTPGGFGQVIRVPAGWVARKPDGLSLREAMILGTAGFTAALCINKLLLNGLNGDKGEVLVTGATGGVGSVAVALLTHLDYRVVASSGKAEARDWLQSLGAKEVIDREEFSEADSKPLLKPRWAGAVDAVGGATLFNVLKSLLPGCSVAACGLVQSPVFEASVLPFILRGVNLLGVDSVEIPLFEKQAMWNKLATDWKLSGLDELVTEIGLTELDDCLGRVLKGQARGRYLVNLDA